MRFQVGDRITINGMKYIGYVSGWIEAPIIEFYQIYWPHIGKETFHHQYMLDRVPEGNDILKAML